MQINGTVFFFFIKYLSSGQTESRARDVSSWLGAVGTDGWTLGWVGRNLLRMSWLELLMFFFAPRILFLFLFWKHIIKLVYFVSTTITDAHFHLSQNSPMYKSELSYYIKRFGIFYNFFIQI